MRRSWLAPAALAAVLALGCAGSGPPPDAGGVQGLSPCPSRPRCVSSLSADPAHEVDPFIARIPPPKAWAAARRAVAALPRTRVVESGPYYLRAESRSRIFHFVDDLELLRQPGSRRIDVRSAARHGWSDLGVNRKRVESLRASLRRVGAIE